MRETDIQIQVEAFIETKDIAGNAANAAKKYLDEACEVQKENRRIIRLQKAREWALYIKDLEIE